MTKTFNIITLTSDITGETVSESCKFELPEGASLEDLLGVGGGSEPPVT